MVLECWVIILILGIAGYMFVRSHKKTWAMGVLPLMLVPFLNILYYPVYSHISQSNLYKADIIRLVIYIVSFVAASCWIVVFARRLPKGRSKYAYAASTILFTAILIIIFIVKLRVLA